MQVLAALDVHTAKWIIDKCFTGDLIRGRTVLLVVRRYSPLPVKILTSLDDLDTQCSDDESHRSFRGGDGNRWTCVKPGLDVRRINQ